MSNLTEHAKAVFLEAIEQHAPEEWCALLDRRCGDDHDLRQRVEMLLRAHEERNHPDDEIRLTDDYQPLEQPGQMIGPYKLRERLGAGGMGIVWAAEQKQPIHRKVALKVIKPGMDSEQVIARFEVERETLALMDHPNIARVLDAGTTDRGRPYFVMELIRGIPITKYCDKYKLTIRERLALFIQVCRAVQHAHQKGVIHRDIKPSNVLVTEQDGEPTPKVIDFGVAKALHQPISGHSVYSGVFQAIGTLPYMSPEQAGLSTADIDTRSDIYGLGVLLYELLTGSTPFDRQQLEQAAVDEALRVIRDQMPLKPSTKVTALDARDTSISQNRGTDLKHLRRSLRGDLDTVVMKALAKDRKLRYETAGAFAADLTRYLNDEPVEACPPSPVYRLRKLWSSHRVAICVAVLMLTALSLGLAVSVWQMILLRRSEQLATQRTTQAIAAESRAQHEATRVAKLLYFAQMNEALHAWNQGIASKTESVLQQYDRDLGPTEDYRGFEWHYLISMVQGSMGRRIFEFPLPAHSVSVSDTGILAVALHEYVVLLDLKTQKEIPGWRFATKKDNSIHQTTGEKNYWSFPFARLSRNGRFLAYPSPNEIGTLLLSDLTSGNTRELTGHGQTVRKAAFSPDARRLVSGDHDGFVRVWDVQTAMEVYRERLHESLVWDLAYSPDGQWTASCGADNRIQLWNPETGERFSLEGHFTMPSTVDGVISIDFSPDGTLLASGGIDRTVRIWDLRTRAQICVLTGNSDEVRSVAFSPDGTVVASGGRDTSVRLWDVSTRRLKAVLHGSSRVSHSVTFTRDGSTVLAAGFDGSVTSWDASVDTSGTLPGLRRVADTACTSDGMTIAAVEGDRAFIRIWRSPTNTAAPMSWSIEPGGIVRGVAFSPRGILGSIDGAGILQLWETSPTATKQVLRKQAIKPRLEPREVALEFSPDGSLLALGGEDGKIWLLDITTFEPKELQGHKAVIDSVAFSYDNRLLVSTSEDDVVLQWNLETGTATTLTELPHQSEPRAIAINRQGLLAVAQRGAVELFDLPTGKRDAPIRATGSLIRFLNDKTLVLAGAGTGEKVGDIELWDTDEKVLRFSLQGHTGDVESLNVAADGTRVISGSLDGSVRIWQGTPSQ